MKKTKNYVNNRDFHNAIVEYHKKKVEALEEGREVPRMPDYIGQCIMSIAKKFATKPSFANYSFKEEMIEDGIENCLLYFDGYNPHRKDSEGNPIPPNPFAYFTTIIKNSFLRRIGTEERKRYVLYKSFVENYDFNSLVDDNNNSLISPKMSDNMNSFMAKFEKKEEERKRKRKEVKNNLLSLLENEDQT